MQMKRMSQRRLPKPNLCSFRIEKQFSSKIVLGVDEVGRGCLAGPLVVAAVSFSEKLWQIKDSWMAEIQDSKKISEKKREELFEKIKTNATYCEILVISSQEIDRLNVLKASLEGFRRLVCMAKSSSFHPEVLLVDGNQRVPGIDFEQRCVVGGDGFSKSIAAASIIAKVTRDRLMKNLSKEFPAYGFEKNKGYGTKAHIEALMANGPTNIHRKTFIPKALKKNQGDEAENLVRNYLESRGFEILKKNWKCLIGEIDLIAQKDNEIHFFEVRNRKDSNVEMAFPLKKQTQVKRLVEAYQSFSKIQGITTRTHFVAVSDQGIEPHWDVFQL